MKQKKIKHEETRTTFTVSQGTRMKDAIIPSTLYLPIWKKRDDGPKKR